MINIMVRKSNCPDCKKPVEVKEEIEYSDHKIIVLKCGHSHRHLVKEIMENISLSDQTTTNVKHVISFESEEDRQEGFYILMLSKTRFNGIEKNKFRISTKQEEILKNKTLNSNVLRISDTN